MSFKQLLKEGRQEWLSHIRPEILSLTQRDKQITLEEWNSLRVNSWEREEIIPFVDDETLKVIVNQTLNNISPPKSTRPYITYDDALIGLLLPELLKRFNK